jgi:S-adenosylmethionine hydrolase
MVVTLLSDMGIRDASVATARAVVMRYVPEASVTDISHQVGQYDIQQAAYLLRSAYRHFPRGTAHIAAVDALGANEPRMVLAMHEGFYFIAPDNGLLQLAFGSELEHVRLGYELTRPYTFAQWMDNAGKIVAAITAGKTEDLPEYKLKPLSKPGLQLMPHGIDCNVLYVDRFDNVVLDITAEAFAQVTKDRSFKITILRMPDITTISHHYSDVKQGEPLCRFNSSGYLELAVNHGSAATLLGIDTNNASKLRYKTVRIFLQ